MAEFLHKGHHKITNDLLQLIKWENKSGEIEMLRLSDLLASVWEKVSDLLKLDINTTTNIATKYNRDPEQCLRDVIGRWMNDQEKLSANYKCTWNGFCQLLKDLRLSTASLQLKEALAADISSFNNNIQRQEVPAARLDHTEKSSQHFIAPFTRTKPHESKSSKVLLRPIYFAALELETMTEDERAQLLDTLQLESHDMICKFADILDNFDNFLIQQSTRIDTVAHMKRTLSKVLKIPPLHKEEKSSSLVSNLSNATTIDEISVILSKYCSFFNYKLLETVFTHMKYDEGHKALRRHEEDLIEYAKRRICHFPSGLGIRDFNHAIIAVKLDDMYEGTLTVHLLTFHRKLCELLRVTLGQCPLDGLKLGCICVTLHLLDHLVKDTFPLSVDQQAALQSLTFNGSKIRSLICKTFIYIPADGPEPILHSQAELDDFIARTQGGPHSHSHTESSHLTGACLSDDITRESTGVKNTSASLQTLKHQRFEMPNLPSYHGELKRKEAERRLSMGSGSLGSNCYLTRYSKGTESYVVSALIHHKGSPTSVHIKLNIDKDNIYSLDGSEKIFRTLDELLDYFENNPLSSEIRGLGTPCLPPDKSHHGTMQQSRESTTLMNTGSGNLDSMDEISHIQQKYEEREKTRRLSRVEIDPPERTHASNCTIL